MLDDSTNRIIVLERFDGLDRGDAEGAPNRKKSQILKQPHTDVIFQTDWPQVRTLELIPGFGQSEAIVFAFP